MSAGGPDYEPEKNVWRSDFLRALVQETEEGSVAHLRRIAIAHPLACHEMFTLGMTEWMMEDNSYPWYDFVGCTALFVASAYARREVCRFLLDNGADPTAECKFPGMDLHSETRTLGPIDVVGQCAPNASEEDLKTLRAMFEERNLLQTPPMPCMSLKCAWHSWVEMIPYPACKYKEGDAVLCSWKNSTEKFNAVVQRVSSRPGSKSQPTYRVLFEPLDGGYYKSRVRPGVNGAPDEEVLFVFKDGKEGAPLYVDGVEEQHIAMPDGTVPPVEERFRRVVFYALRAKAYLDWSCYWIPSKSYCKDLKFQLRFRDVSVGGDWNTVQLEVPRYTLQGLLLAARYEVQVRVRNGAGWSDFSTPLLVIDTPPPRKGAKAQLSADMPKYGYARDLNPSGAEEATPEDWEWLEERDKRGKVSPISKGAEKLP